MYRYRSFPKYPPSYSSPSLMERMTRSSARKWPASIVLRCLHLGIHLRLRFLAIFLLACVSPQAVQAQDYTIQKDQLTLSFNKNMETKLVSGYATTPLMVDFEASEYLQTVYGTIKEYPLQSHTSKAFNDSLGKGILYTVTGMNKAYQLEKRLTIRTYEGLPDAAYFEVMYINHGTKTIPVTSWINNDYSFRAARDTTPFWSFQGSSSSARADWILPLSPGFYQQNYMGMNNADYGGGIPVVDVWRPDGGVAIGQAEAFPVLVSLPVRCDVNDSSASIAVHYNYEGKEQQLRLRPGDTLHAFETFVSVHPGDCFYALRGYGRYLQKKGIKAPQVEPEAFEPLWCAWGYGRDFSIEEIKQTIPKVKELGIKWIGIDDGFQQAIGDWHTRKAVFPGGDQEMKELVHWIHEQGLKASLWWAPLAVAPDSKALKNDANLLLVQKSGAPQYITWWDAYYMAPTYKGTRDAAANTVQLFLKDWGFDGIKMDGQHLNAVAPDYGDGHGIEDPIAADRYLPNYFKLIYDTAMHLNPNAVLQLCPCGDCMSVFNMPYTNQFVASDPESSWQVRLKGKVYKAIMPTTPYFGDHVELTDGGQDFASQFGIGAVLGTKFTWPATGDTIIDANLLTPAKEKLFKKWIGLYHQKMLSTGNYLGGLYDIGYDYPEAYAIAKGDTLYYSFYNPDYKGTIDLRGLAAGSEYVIRDYFHDTTLGVVTADNPTLQVAFKDFLLIEVIKK